MGRVLCFIHSVFVLLPGEVARGLDRNNSPRERTSPKEVNCNTCMNLSCIISILGRVFFLENKLSANYREEICCKVSRLRYTSFLLEMNRKGEVKSMCFCYSKVSWQISPLLSLLIEFRSYLNHNFLWSSY